MIHVPPCTIGKLAAYDDDRRSLFVFVYGFNWSDAPHVPLSYGLFIQKMWDIQMLVTMIIKMCV